MEECSMTTRFIAEVSQSGGCDYTIECGTQVVDLDGDTLTEAIVSFRKLFDPYNHDTDEEGGKFGPGDDIRISSATIYEVAASTSVNMGEIYATAKAKQAEAQKKRQLAKDQAELARLQAKLGKSK